MPAFLEAKKCATCREHKPISEFSKRKRITSQGEVSYFRSACRPCEAVAGREWRLLNPIKSRKATTRWRENNQEKVSRQDRNHHFQRSFGLTIEDVDRMIEQQEGKCANIGCRRTLSRGRKTDSAHLDHDHKTGKVRAVLCQACNVALGRLREDPNVIAGLLEYLREHA